VYKRKRVDAAEKAVTAKKERDENRIKTIWQLRKNHTSKWFPFMIMKKLVY